MGMVRIEIVNNRLRLRWSHGGSRYCLSLGLTNTTTHYVVAQQKATQIELDIISGNFDASLNKYRGKDSRKRTSPVTLFDAFFEHKKRTIHNHTHPGYESTRRILVTYLDKHRHFDPEHFLLWYVDYDNTSVEVKARRVRYLKGAWAWALKRGLCDVDPWQGVDLPFRTQPKQPPQPLTTGEVAAIAQHIDPHYKSFFLFLVGTGCRLGEACGLHWSALSHDTSSLWVGRSYSQRTLMPVKCNRPRTIVLSPSIRTLIEQQPQHSEYVFTTKRGHPIELNNYRNLVWRPALDRADVPYRKPYITRATFISHVLDRGTPPVVVAQYTGHTLEVLYKHYAGNIQSKTIPDILELFE
jgi:integrase